MMWKGRVVRAASYAVLAGLALAPAARAAGYATAYDDDGAVTVNGERTFIIGSYSVEAGAGAEPATLETYKAFKEAGFNLVHGDGAAGGLAHEAGLMTWTSVGTIDLAKVEESTEKLKQAVLAIRDNPALAFIESVDEPAWTWLKPEARVPAEALAAAYPIIKELAPDKLLYLNHAPTNLVSTMQPYNAGTDVVAMDIYPVNPGGLRSMFALFPDGHQGDLNNTTISQVGDYVDKMRQVTGPNRPLFMVLQAFAWEGLAPEAERIEEKLLYPTYAQSRFMAFQSIIKGANGIVYWGSHTTPRPSECWTGITRTTREIAGLGPVLVERTVSPALELTYREMGHSVDDGIQWMAKEHAGDLYLLTCNADKNPAQATFAGLGDYTVCRVLGEDRTPDLLPFEGESFTDTWQRFGVHVYRLSRT